MKIQHKIIEPWMLLLDKLLLVIIYHISLYIYIIYHLLVIIISHMYNDGLSTYPLRGYLVSSRITLCHRVLRYIFYGLRLCSMHYWSLLLIELSDYFDYVEHCDVFFTNVMLMLVYHNCGLKKSQWLTTTFAFR